MARSTITIFSIFPVKSVSGGLPEEQDARKCKRPSISKNFGKVSIFRDIFRILENRKGARAIVWPT
jgi:hypothetical protein